MEAFLKHLTIHLVYAIEAAAVLIIAGAAAKAILGSVLILFRWRAPVSSADGPEPGTSQEDIRLELGRWLALALEFELAADILRTAVAPSWDEIGKLAAIIVLRTALNYFLRKEIEKAARPPNIRSR